jgi:hypothetical protein
MYWRQERHHAITGYGSRGRQPLQPNASLQLLPEAAAKRRL